MIAGVLGKSSWRVAVTKNPEAIGQHIAFINEQALGWIMAGFSNEKPYYFP
jgi:hypothetical protein